MNRNDYYRFIQSVENELKLLRKKISSGNTTITVDIYGTKIMMLSVQEFSHPICDTCFNQLICQIWETVRCCPGNRFVNRCIFFREEPTELINIQMEHEMKKIEMMEEMR